VVNSRVFEHGRERRRVLPEPTRVVVPVRDAAGTRLAAYASIDRRSEWIRPYPWHRLTAGGEPLTFSHPLAGGRPTTMARVILGLVDREEVGVRHRNGDVLDNRVANLVAFEAQPAAGPEGAKRSRYRGVLWDPEHEQWAAYGYSGGRYVDLGRFDDELGAARAARSWALDNQSVHLEDDFRAGGFGRASRAPTEASEAQRGKPIGGVE
jgi:AP2 domain